MLRCVGYCCQKNNLHCEGYPPPTSRTFKNLDTLAESKTQYTANAQTVSAYGHKDKDIILEGLSDSRRLEHEVSIKELLTIPLQTKTPAHDYSWSSPELRTSRREETFKRVDSLQPDVEVGAKTENAPETQRFLSDEHNHVTIAAYTASLDSISTSPSLSGHESSCSDPEPVSVCSSDLLQIGQWCAADSDAASEEPTTKKSSDTTRAFAPGGKRKAKPSQAFVKRQKRDQEDDGSPSELPRHANWISDSIDEEGFPCIYDVFHPAKYPECPVFKRNTEISHYLQVPTLLSGDHY